MPQKKKEQAEQVNLDFGFGGLFKGLGNFVDLLSEMVDTAETAEDGSAEVKRTGEFKVKGMGEKGRGIYGFTVRTGIGGMPKVERFGNIRATDAGPVVAEVREPMVDTFDEAHEFVVVAELPGVGEDEIRVAVQDDILSLETTGERKYAKEILLSHPVDSNTLKKTYKNGILELRLKKLA